MAKKNSVDSNRKDIEWTEDRVNMISALYLNGYSDEDVAKLIPCSVGTLHYRINQNPEVKVKFNEAKSIAIANATKALQKIAEGYFEEEITYGTEFKARTEMMQFFGDIIEYIPQLQRDDYQEKAESLFGKGEIIKTVRKWYPPNKDAITKILDAHQSDTWDLEAKRKKIPQLKINVTLDKKQVEGHKEIPADYELVQ